MLLKVLACFAQKARLLGVVSVLLLVANIAYSQNSATMRCKWVKQGRGNIQLDTNNILSESIRITFPKDSAISFEYDDYNGKLKINAPSNVDSVLICYKVFNFNLSKPYFKREKKLLDSTNYFRDDVYRYKNYAIREQREELFPSKGFSKSGSISRGFSVGNNQNVFVNSALNLQLEGYITNDIKMTAAITDQNVPVQPDGVTQNVQQFDQVYIQLEHEKGKLTAGDFIMKNKEGYFLKYYKNVQGGQLDLNYKAGEHGTANTLAGISLAKGKFNTALFIGSALSAVPNSQLLNEGVLGPYKLLGQNNETAIVVVANSEKIFLDGRQLVRGYNNDYTINYNSSEITFTSRVMITKYSQIRVDFEYFDRNYPRTNIQGSHYQTYKNFSLGLNFYQEKDNQNQPVNMTLSDKDRQTLANIGDTLIKAIISSGDSVGFTQGQILYRLVKDSVTVNGSYPNVYVYSADPVKAVYTVGFSNVGQGNGDYIQVVTATNGRVYQWLEPQGGVRQGNYAPAKLIVTPKKKSMITGQAAWDLTKSDKIYTEVAASENDLNLYSSVDSYDDKGNAWKVGYINKGKDFTPLKGYKWTASVDYEYNQKYFTPIERFRDANFDWEWNVPASTPGVQSALNTGTAAEDLRSDDNIFNASVGVNKGGFNQLNYKLTRRLKEKNADGYQHRVVFNKKVSRVQLQNDLFIMSNKLPTTTANWLRLNVSAYYVSRYIVPGYIYTTDKNQVKANYSANGDSVISSLQNFEQHKVYFKTNDTLKTRFYIDGVTREDFTPIAGNLLKSASTLSSTASLNTRVTQNHDVGISMIYRKVSNEKLRLTDTIATEENIQGRFDWGANLFKRHVRSELTLASSSGRQPKREYVYLQVTKGQGNYYWRDDNNDGIQQLGEFYEAQFSDQKDYIKIYTPTNQYISAYNNILNYRLNITAPRGWRDKKGMLNVLSRFSNTTSYSLERNITNSEVKYRLVPFLNDIAKEDLLANLSNLRTTLFFNRTSPVYGLDYSYINLDQKQILTNGFENRTNNDNQLNARVNIGRMFNIKNLLAYSIKTSSSDYLSTKNFADEFYTIKPEIAFQPSDFLRLTASYRHSLNQGIGQSAGQKANVNEAGIETRWSKVTKRTVQASLKLVDMFYIGELNTPLSYDLLEGLSAGQNLLWNLSWQQKLASGLQVNLIYEGRKTQTAPAVHTGRMQVSALF